MSQSASHHLSLLLLLVAAVYSEKCDRFKQCNGPIRYYEDLNCKPVYEKPGDCCAVRYDCSHLSNRSADKCYVNGREYNINEPIRNEDRPNPCDVGCFCRKGSSDIAEFNCVQIDCFHEYKPGCYIKHKPDDCCGTRVCSDEPSPVECVVDGKNYTDGQHFYPKEHENLVCTCMDGYKGENVEPFCRKINCGTELRSASELRSNCAPVFYESQTPQTSCNYAYRCESEIDSVIPAKNQKSDLKNTSSEEYMCKFGNMTMRIGDELSQATKDDSLCVKCVCEVPPTPTCVKFSDKYCRERPTIDYSP